MSSTVHGELLRILQVSYRLCLSIVLYEQRNRIIQAGTPTGVVEHFLGYLVYCREELKVVQVIHGAGDNKYTEVAVGQARAAAYLGDGCRTISYHLPWSGTPSCFRYVASMLMLSQFSIPLSDNPVEISVYFSNTLILEQGNSTC